VTSNQEIRKLTPERIQSVNDTLNAATALFVRDLSDYIFVLRVNGDIAGWFGSLESAGRKRPSPPSSHHAQVASGDAVEIHWPHASQES
jgi:hypothetical protein